jgi:hypothetical protein
MGPEHVRRVAHAYTDRGNPHLPGDEFSAWLSAGDRTVQIVTRHGYKPI